MRNNEVGTDGPNWVVLTIVAVIFAWIIVGILIMAGDFDTHKSAPPAALDQPAG